jgi:hypothetical protein
VVGEQAPGAILAGQMKVNTRMRRYLADLRSREVGAAAVPAAPAIHLVEANGLVLLRGFIQKPHGTLSEFPNETALECTANRLRMEAMVEPRLARSAPLLLLTAGLVTAGAMALALRSLKGSFNVIVSYDGEGCAVRFHKIRAAQRWLMNDLEDYEGEGVLVFEAGPDQPAPMLLS